MKEEITINSLKKAGFIEFREHKHESINSDAIRLEEPVQFSPEELKELFEKGKGNGLYFDNSRYLHTYSVVKKDRIESFVAETLRLDEPIKITPCNMNPDHMQIIGQTGKLEVPEYIKDSIFKERFEHNSKAREIAESLRKYGCTEVKVRDDNE